MGFKLLSKVKWNSKMFPIQRSFTFGSRLWSGIQNKRVRCNSSYYGETYRHLKVRFEKHTGISPLIFRKRNTLKKSAIRDNLLIWNNIPSSEEFTILAYRYHIFLKSKKACLFSKIDLFWIRTLAVLRGRGKYGHLPDIHGNQFFVGNIFKKK